MSCLLNTTATNTTAKASELSPELLHYYRQSLYNQHYRSTLITTEIKQFLADNVQLPNPK